jgi:hypothetical protein
MANFWLAKKNIKVKDVEWTMKDGKSNIVIELACGRKYRCRVSPDFTGSNGEAILETGSLSYTDPRFYTQPGDMFIGHELEAWDQDIFEWRYGLIERVAFEILTMMTGELPPYAYDREWYDKFDTSPFDFFVLSRMTPNQG